MRTAQRHWSTPGTIEVVFLSLTFRMEACNGHVGRTTLGRSRGLIFNTVANSFVCPSPSIETARIHGYPLHVRIPPFNDTFCTQA